MRVAFGTDERTDVTDAIVELLRAQSHEVEVVGLNDTWPLVGRSAAERVVAGKCDRAIVCCWTGTGVSIAANKVPGARAALCGDSGTAVGARRWNDANVLAIALQNVSVQSAKAIVEAFLTAPFDESERSNIEAVESP